MNSNNVNTCTINKTDSSATSQAGSAYRFWAAFIALGCLAVLAVAGYVKPAPVGVGTHQQLNLPACGFYELTGYPCPTCGMTTAFSQMVRGRVLRSFAVQPAGAIGALVCVFVAVVSGWVALGARRVDKYIYRKCTRWPPICRLFNSVYSGWIIVSIIAVIVLLSWGWVCLLTWLRGI
jgi:hypothetical protein